MNNDLSVKMQNALQKASGKLEEIIINTYDHLEHMYDKYDILKENGNSNDSQIINNIFNRIVRLEDILDDLFDQQDELDDKMNLVTK